MIPFLLAWVGGASACEVPKSLGDTVQVAWVSPVPKQVGASAMLTVVRTADLRTLVVERGRDPTRSLQLLGLLAPRQEIRQDYKITLFDVKAEWLCRPMAGEEGTVVAGLRICDENQQDRGWGIHPKVWTDCGYLVDMMSGVRTLDVYRIAWEEAVTWGFCVMPLSRFLEGA